MYNNHKVYIGIIFSIFFILSFLINIKITESAMQNFITFLSIVFGFYMTSLSVLYNSKYIKNMYQEIDPKKPTQRKITTLIQYFKHSAYLTVFTIFLLMITSLIVNIDNNILIINPIFQSFLISIVFSNFIFIILLFKVFINSLIKEAKYE